MKNLKRKNYTLNTADSLFQIIKKPKGKYVIWLNNHNTGNIDNLPKSFKDNIKFFNKTQLSSKEVKEILNNLDEDFNIYPLSFDSAYYEDKIHSFNKDAKGNIIASYKTAYFNKNILPFIKIDKSDLYISLFPAMATEFNIENNSYFQKALAHYKYEKLAYNYFHNKQENKSAKSFKEAIANLEKATEDFMKNKIITLA